MFSRVGFHSFWFSEKSKIRFSIGQKVLRLHKLKCKFHNQKQNVKSEKRKETKCNAGLPPFCLFVCFTLSRWTAPHGSTQHHNTPFFVVNPPPLFIVRLRSFRQWIFDVMDPTTVPSITSFPTTTTELKLEIKNNDVLKPKENNFSSSRSQESNSLKIITPPLTLIPRYYFDKI